jgi:regulator of nucleoside diphosphate kinase
VGWIAQLNEMIGDPEYKIGRPRQLFTGCRAPRRLLAAIPASVFPNKAQLQSELDRADVLAPEQMPATVVTMNSTVKFSIEETGKEFCLTLVYPRDMDGSTDRISIFAPVGSALLGLSVGDSLAWPGPGGKTMTVHVTEIIYQPERAGELHR